jgi:hypothetical protein
MKKPLIYGGKVIASMPAPRYGFTISVMDDMTKEEGSINKYQILFHSDEQGTRTVFQCSNADRALAWACGYLFGYTDKADERQCDTSKPEVCSVGSTEVENCR